MKLKESHLVIFGLLLILGATSGYAQIRDVQLKLFGHVQYDFNDLSGNAPLSYFSLGEQDFFVTSNLSDRISFIGETVIEYDADKSTFEPDIERAQLKWNFYKNHSLIAGKMYTPLNYWNDVFTHARLYFPTIDRPMALDHFMPLHSLGFRLQGQNLGRLGFGYDLSISNTISSSEILDYNLNKAITSTIHLKPVESLQITASYFNDYLSSNSGGLHSDHFNTNSTYSGAVNYELVNFSVAYFGKKIEWLSESSYNKTKTDSLGVAENYAQYVYAGYRLKEKHLAYLVYDIIEMSDRELHTRAFDGLKFGAGYRYDLAYNCILKFQLERYQSDQDHFFHFDLDHPGNLYSIKCQLAYGF